MRESVVITGGAGFIGSHLAGAIVRWGGRVVVCDNLFTGSPENLVEFKDQVKLVRGDILDLSFLIRTMMGERVGGVIHTAALVSFGPSIEKLSLTAKINIKGTISILEGAMLAFDAKNPESRILHVASGKAYTYEEMGRMVETIVLGPKISVGPGLLKQSEMVDAQQKGALDIRRAQSQLGYQPKYDLYDGLVNYTEALKASGFP